MKYKRFCEHSSDLHTLAMLLVTNARSLNTRNYPSRLPPGEVTWTANNGRYFLPVWAMKNNYNALRDIPIPYFFMNSKFLISAEK